MDGLSIPVFYTDMSPRGQKREEARTVENGAVEQKLRELGYALPARPEGGGSYVHVKEFGDGLAYVSGCGPELDGELAFRGQVGA